MEPPSPIEPSHRIDLGLFRPEASRGDVEVLCAEARKQSVHGISVNTSRIELARALVEDTHLKVIGLVGFPFGGADADVKRYETEVAVDLGAHEIETVIHIGRLKDGDHQAVLRELRDIAEAAEERPVCVVVEQALLTAEEMLLACHLILDSGAIMICPGFAFFEDRQVSPAQVKELRQVLGPKFGIKIEIPPAQAETHAAFIDAGASRIGVPWSLKADRLSRVE